MDIIELFDALGYTTGADWSEASDLLMEAGYTWEWFHHINGTDTFLLSDKKPE